MTSAERKNRCASTLGLVACILATLTGCQPFDLYSKSLHAPLPAQLEPPTELSMVSLPEYRVEPRDILQLDIVKLVPLPPYRVDVYDVLNIRAAFALPDEPINDFYVVNEQGDVDLGPVYGKVHVLGLPLAEVQPVVVKKLQQILRQPEVTVQLARTGGTQQVNGIYLVQPGGVINLNKYGTVHVAGKTLVEARLAVEKQLAQFFDSPRVAVSVAGFNSAKYYIVFEGTSEGEDVISLPITGKETVLDAIGSVGGLKSVSSKELWISRPAPGDFGSEQILPIDYMAITRGGSTTTNYQLMPGDRLFIAEDSEVGFNGYLTKVTAPINQLFGISQLGASTARDFQTMGRQYNINRRGR
jgi:protein involved in polysaccharide export with SLBB domain